MTAVCRVVAIRRADLQYRYESYVTADTEACKQRNNVKNWLIRASADQMRAFFNS